MKRTILTFTVAVLAVFGVRALSFSVGNYKYYTTGDTEVTVDGFSAGAPNGKNYVDFPGMVTYGGKTYYVTTVGSYAFAYNVNIEEAVIPYGVTEIEENAFAGCTNLDVVRLPGTMERLQSDCFNGCTAGLYVYCTADTPPVCVDGPFDGAKLLRLIVRRDEPVKEIPDTYKAATGWKDFPQVDTKTNAYDVVLDEGKTTASYYVISWPSGVTLNGVLYRGVATLVGGGTACKVADKVTLNGEDYVVREIGENAFSKSGSVNSGIKTISGCKNVKTVYGSAFEGSSLESASFPILETIFDKAFKNCTALTTIDLDTYGPLEAIGSEAFSGCTSLTSFVMPRGGRLLSIYDKAFYGCSSLNYVVLYRNTSSLGDMAFANCTSLANVSVHTSPVSLGSNVFKNTASKRYLHVPPSFINDYSGKAQWKDFTAVYGNLDKVYFNGKLFDQPKYTDNYLDTDIEGVFFDPETMIVLLKDAYVDISSSSEPLIRTECPDLTIRLKGTNVVNCRGFVKAVSGTNPTYGNVTILGKYFDSDDGKLLLGSTNNYTFDFHEGGSLTIKDVSYMFEQNANCASFYGNSTLSSVLTINNSSGQFERRDRKGNVLARMKLALEETALTNCTYSASATQYGADEGVVKFETLTTSFGGDLYIAGTKVTNLNRAKDAIVKGVSVGTDGTVTLDNVNYSSSSATFIKTGLKIQNIVLLGDNTVNASVFLRAENSSVIIEGGGTATLSTTGTNSGVANFYFVNSDYSCRISNVKKFYNAAAQYPFLGKSGKTNLYIINSSGEFKRTGSGNIAIAQIKQLVLTDTRLTNCTYSETATQYGNNGSVQFESTKDTGEPEVETITVGGNGAKYDVNGDERINVADVNYVLKLILAEQYESQADVNNDNSVNVADVNSILAEILSPSGSSVSFKMVQVKGGTFMMGADDSDSNARDAEKPRHQVTLSDYRIGELEVTEGLWKAVMGTNPSKNVKGDDYPVENVTWEQCNEFITKLNKMTGQTFRLPTEAEWEYAARGGSKSKGYIYAGGDTADDVAWNPGNSDGAKHPVRQKTANELGLYDMSGNVLEWVYDTKGDYPSTAVTDPTGPGTVTDASRHIQRGGSWYYNVSFCRSTARVFAPATSGYNDCGLRLVK